MTLRSYCTQQHTLIINDITLPQRANLIYFDAIIDLSLSLQIIYKLRFNISENNQEFVTLLDTRCHIKDFRKKILHVVVVFPQYIVIWWLFETHGIIPNLQTEHNIKLNTTFDMNNKLYNTWPCSSSAASATATEAAVIIMHGWYQWMVRQHEICTWDEERKHAKCTGMQIYETMLGCDLL